MNRLSRTIVVQPKTAKVWRIAVVAAFADDTGPCRSRRGLDPSADGVAALEEIVERRAAVEGDYIAGRAGKYQAAAVDTVFMGARRVGRRSVMGGAPG